MVLPDAFHLGWMGATRRLFDLANSFKELNYTVILLAGKMTNVKQQTIIDNEFPGKVIRTKHTGAYPVFLDFGNFPRRVWRIFWKLSGDEQYHKKLSYGWAEKLNVSNVMKLLEANSIKPDVVWGVSAGYLGGAYAANKIAEALKVPWILELHDPPRGCDLRTNKKLISNEFSNLLETSSRQVVTTWKYKQYIVENFNIDNANIHTIHLTYDDDSIKNKKTFKHNQKMHIFYAGSLSGGRSISPILIALNKAANQFPSIKEKVLLEIAGTGPGLDEAKKLSDSLGIQNMVKFHGYIPFGHVEELRYTSDIQVVLQTEETSTLQVPGKVFDCLKYSKPILALMPVCEAANILEESGLGFIHSMEDVEGLSDTIVKLWTDWTKGETPVQLDESYIYQFSVKNLSNKIKPVLEGIESNYE